ncbi:TPA: ABC-three component system middle component 1 [Klebsiella pneumoniae]
MPTIQELITAITQRAEGRYEVHVPDMNDMVSPSIDFGTAAVRLKRLKLVKAGWRTVLITECPYGVEYIQSAFRWAADVRDMLAEPQTVDLYMFMLIKGIESEDASRFETDDRFCRKIVLREEEDIDSFLDRSFLASLTPVSVGNEINDPLLASLSSLCQVHSWVKPHIEQWRELLLSEKTGDEVVQSLKTVTFGDKGRQ